MSFDKSFGGSDGHGDKPAPQSSTGVGSEASPSHPPAETRSPTRVRQGTHGRAAPSHATRTGTTPSSPPTTAAQKRRNDFTTRPPTKTGCSAWCASMPESFLATPTDWRHYQVSAAGRRNRLIRA